LDTYELIFKSASELCVNALYRHLSYNFLGCEKIDGKVDYTEGFQLYFLQILELEESLGCQIMEKSLIQQQVFELTNILLYMKNEVAAMHVKKIIKNPEDLNLLSSRERGFYWNDMINHCEIILRKLEEKWVDFEYDRKKILNLVFGPTCCWTFPYYNKEQDPIDKFFPYILKYADLELVKERFSQKNKGNPSWDASFNWVELHIKAADYLLLHNPEKAKAYFEKAKLLTEKTLWSFPFSFYWSSWKEKEDQARRLIEDRKSLFE
jgi:hypothetical protein